MCIYISHSIKMDSCILKQTGVSLSVYVSESAYVYAFAYMFVCMHVRASKQHVCIMLL